MPAMAPTDDWSYDTPQDMDDQLNVVRYYVQDTDSAVRLLRDSELQFLIDTWLPVTDSIIDVAAEAAENIATKFAGVVSVSADGVSVNVADVSERYSARATELRETAQRFRVGEIDIANLLWNQDWDLSIDPLQFGVGFQDNPEAGRQNYGTNRWDASHDSVGYRDSVGWL